LISQSRGLGDVYKRQDDCQRAGQVLQSLHRLARRLSLA
jgi:hypothetical protein